VLDGKSPTSGKTGQKWGTLIGAQPPVFLGRLNAALEGPLFHGAAGTLHVLGETIVWNHSQVAACEITPLRPTPLESFFSLQSDL